MAENKRRFLGAFMAEGDLDIVGHDLDAVGDTMNGGRIFLHADAADAAGYAMWGGGLYIRGNAGDHAGIHMKATATLVVGGSAGAFLGEYQAGGTIIVLGLNSSAPLLGANPFAGMHGGRAFLRGTADCAILPEHIAKHPATQMEMDSILPHLEACAARFDWSLPEILGQPFTVLTPLTHRPYKTMYTPIV